MLKLTKTIYPFKDRRSGKKIKVGEDTAISVGSVKGCGSEKIGTDYKIK